MTWTYTTNLTAARDQVRFYSGDTVSTATITLSDEEIAGAITLAGGTRAAAALCCESLAARYSAGGQRLVDDLGQTVDYGERATFFQERGRLLRSQLSLTAIPFAGGISITSKQSQEDNTDRVVPAFTKDLHKAPGTTDNDLTEL